jgi:hypothetical protein
MTFLVGITSATLGNHVATYIVVVADKSPTNDSHFDEHDFLGVRGEICKFLQKCRIKKVLSYTKKVTTGFRVSGFSGFGLAGLRVSG